MIKFNYIDRTGLSEAEVRKRATSHQRTMNRRFGAGTTSLQDAVDSVIDAAIEYAQGGEA